MYIAIVFLSLAMHCMSHVYAGRIDDFICELPAFPGIPAPSCDPSNSHCCSGLYCVVDPSDPAGLLHVCQEYQPNRQPTTQQQSLNATASGAASTTGAASKVAHEGARSENGMRSIKVAALLSARASDYAFTIINNLQRAYKLVNDELTNVKSNDKNQKGMKNDKNHEMEENSDAVEQAAYISSETEMRVVTTENNKRNDGFDWSQYDPYARQHPTKKQKRDGYSQYFPQGDKHRLETNHKSNSSSFSLTFNSTDEQEKEIKRLITEAENDLRTAAGIMQDKISSDAQKVGQSALDIAQNKMLETAHQLLLTAIQLTQQLSIELSNAEKEISKRKATLPPSIPTDSTATTSNSQNSLPVSMVIVHESVSNALDSAELATESLACADSHSENRQEHCKKAQELMKLIKSSLQIIHATTNLSFEWEQFAPANINKGDRAIGALDGPCGKTSSKDFGKCEKPLECIGVTKHSPGTCRQKLSKKERIQKAINLALDAANKASVFANHVRSAVSQLQVSMKYDNGIMQVLTNKEILVSPYPDNSSKIQSTTTTASTMIIAVTASAIGMFVLYALCIRYRSQSKNNYQPI